ncbi:hypothetical protein [Saccharopolyspora hordei]|uniref:Uncharacterized protein n=1 Tax=Saccharopolyspora hordei TaxID=1838 RepID=A0A853AQQ2_9PSEU|nr:hypothetical protein [Saccharopolyspora hordei]NYI83141.1 hypothetical protein [Saccharopolyspora hordei]
MSGVRTTRVPVWAPHPGRDGQVVRASAEVSWQRGDGGVRVCATGPWHPVQVSAPDVFRAFWGVRHELPRVTFFAQGARVDAWHGTAQHPCDIDQTVLCPRFGWPPDPAPVPVLAALPERDAGLLAPSCELHLLYRREWAGEVPPGGLTWTAFRDHLRSQRG